VIHRLSNKSGSWDHVPEELATLVHSLVQNVKYKHSSFIFKILRNNFNPPKFYIFPRFLQHIITCELKEKLQNVGDTLDIGHMKPYLFKTFKKAYVGFSGHITPLPARMLELLAPGNNPAVPAEVEPIPALHLNSPKFKYLKLLNLLFPLL
jgi:hypothetical protein